MHDFLDFHFLVTLRVQNREKMRNFFFSLFFLPLSLLSKLRCFSSKQFTKIDHTCPHFQLCSRPFYRLWKMPNWAWRKYILKPSKIYKKNLSIFPAKFVPILVQNSNTFEKFEKIFFFPVLNLNFRAKIDVKFHLGTILA